MSYILDALRRADAERQQGQVPGLNATAGPHAPASSAGRRVLAWWGAGAVLVVLGASIAYWWPRPQAQPMAATQPSLPVVVAVAPPLPIVVSAASPAPPAAPASAPSVPAPEPAAASAAPPKPVPLQQLGPEQRRELPRLVLGGSVWSASVASRFIVLDGQVLREGDTVAPGLVLERIQPKSAVLRWRELRLELAL